MSDCNHEWEEDMEHCEKKCNVIGYDLFTQPIFKHKFFDISYWKRRSKELRDKLTEAEGFNQKWDAELTNKTQIIWTLEKKLIEADKFREAVENILSLGETHSEMGWMLEEEVAKLKKKTQE